MMQNDTAGGGLNESVMSGIDQEAGDGAGGGSGGGTIAGAGDPSGGATDGAGAPADSLAARSGDDIATEAALLGTSDGSLADAARQGDGPKQPGVKTEGGEGLGGGAGMGVGSGTPPPPGELGGGGPLGQHGGTGPAGTATSDRDA